MREFASLRDGPVQGPLFAFICVLSAMVFSHADAWAEPPSEPRVLVLYTDEISPVVPLLRGELQSRGFSAVVEEADTANPDVLALKTKGAAQNAVAVLLLQPIEQGPDMSVWVIDLVADKTTTQTLVGLSEDDGVVARRLVELLRASLIEEQVAPVVKKEPPEPPPEKIAEPSQPPPPPTPGPFSLSLGSSVVWSPGGLSPSLLLDTEFGYRASDRVSVLAGARFPIVSAKLEHAEGRAEISSIWTTIGVQFHLLPPESAWNLQGGLFVGAIGLKITGEGNPPNEGITSTRWLAVVGLVGGGSWQLTARLAVTAEVEIARSSPRVQFLFLGQDEATWGEVILSGGLGMRFHF